MQIDNDYLNSEYIKTNFRTYTAWPRNYNKKRKNLWINRHLYSITKRK